MGLPNISTSDIVTTVMFAWPAGPNDDDERELTALGSHLRVLALCAITSLYAAGTKRRT